MKSVIIDSDAGVDDVMALALALRSPELRVEGISTVGGNVEVEQCTRNCLLTIEALQMENPPPVATGEAQPLERSLVTAKEVHGPDGIGGITQPVVGRDFKSLPTKGQSLPLIPLSGPQLIVDLASRLGSDLTIVTLGPLTNIARAIEIDREAMLGVGEIVMMGGAFRVYGNTSVVAEFNVYVDPEAAQRTIELGVPLTIVPLDVTEQVRLMRSELQERLAAAPSPLLEFIRDVSSFYMDYHAANDGFDGCYMHDPLTVGAVIDRSLVRTVRTRVAVEAKGDLTRGMTVAELRPERLPHETNAPVAVGVDSERFLKLFLDRMQ